MAWSSHRVYDVTRLVIYALVGIFLISTLVAAISGPRWYNIYDLATLIARITMFVGAVVAPTAAIAGAHAYYTGQFKRKRKPQINVTPTEEDRLQRIYNQLSSDDEAYLREQLTQQRLSEADAGEILTDSESQQARNKRDL